MSAYRAALLDRIGMLGSALCTLHCAALPLLLMLVPASAFAIGARGTWRHDVAYWVLRLHGHERWLVFAALALAAVSLGLGWRRHRRLQPTLLALPAAVCLGTTALSAAQLPVMTHLLLPLIGGALLLLAHAANLRAARRC